MREGWVELERSKEFWKDLVGRDGTNRLGRRNSQSTFAGCVRNTKSQIGNMKKEGMAPGSSP